MELFRITQEKFADDLSGNGSRLFGGRWNSEGFFALYTSSSRSLSLLETLAHTPAKMLGAKIYYLITLYVPGDQMAQKASLANLPVDWDAPDTRPFTKKLGDQFLHNKKALLLDVPSVLMPEESNFVLNPLYEDMKKVKIVNKRRIVFDKRIDIKMKT